MKLKPYNRESEKERLKREREEFETQRFYYENRELLDGLRRTIELTDKTADTLMLHRIEGRQLYLFNEPANNQEYWRGMNFDRRDV